jgi:diaminopimelate epimerase
MKHLDFRKLQGCGNSFVVSAYEKVQALVKDKSEFARSICSASHGLGADGFFVVTEPQAGLCRVEMFNPDGSLMGMCGNGVRCLARHLVLEGWLSEGSGNIDFEVEERRVSCAYTESGRVVKVQMGEPSVDPKIVPVNSPKLMLASPLECAGKNFEVSAVHIGNPHCVIMVNEVDSIPLLELGPQIENHPLFPKRTNVEFVERVSNSSLKVRIWERGAGATLASGTGACASMVIAYLLGHTGPEVKVQLPGGELQVSWQGWGSPVFLEGPAESICEGQFQFE